MVPLLQRKAWPGKVPEHGAPLVEVSAQPATWPVALTAWPSLALSPDRTPKSVTVYVCAAATDATAMNTIDRINALKTPVLFRIRLRDRLRIRIDILLGSDFRDCARARFGPRAIGGSAGSRGEVPRPSAGILLWSGCKVKSNHEGETALWPPRERPLG
jgi:hypothetical protein